MRKVELSRVLDTHYFHLRRDEEENCRIRLLAEPDDLLLEVQSWPSPLTLLRGGAEAEEIRRAAAITARYSDAPGPEVMVCYGAANAVLEESIQVSPMSEEELDELRI